MWVVCVCRSKKSLFCIFCIKHLEMSPEWHTAVCQTGLLIDFGIWLVSVSKSLNPPPICQHTTVRDRLYCLPHPDWTLSCTLKQKMWSSLLWFSCGLSRKVKCCLSVFHAAVISQWRGNSCSLDDRLITSVVVTVVMSNICWFHHLSLFGFGQFGLI